MIVLPVPCGRVNRLSKQPPVGHHNPAKLIAKHAIASIRCSQTSNCHARNFTSIRPSCFGGFGAETGSGRKVSCRHILVDSKQQLDEVAIKLESGDRFEDLAEEFSTCSSGRAGGDIGWIIKGMASSAVEEAVLHKEVGSVVTADSEGGWHLIEILEENQPPTAKSQAPVGRLSAIDVRTLSELLADPVQVEEAQFIDVRELHEFEVSRLKEFSLYPLSQMGSWLPSITKDLDPSKDTYVLCHHGIRSQHAATFMLRQGFTKLYNVTGGIAAFSQIDPSVPQY